jgi:hypothetical protein
MLAGWPRRLQAQYLDALARFDPPIPLAERRRLDALLRPRDR